MRVTPLRALGIVIWIFSVTAAQPAEDIIAAIYDYKLPQHTLSVAVRVRQLLTPEFSQSQAETVKIETTIQFLTDKVELVEGKRRHIGASEAEVEQDLQSDLDKAKKFVSENDIHMLRNLALAEARSFEDYNALPNKSDPEARKVYQKYAQEFKQYSKEDFTFERWMARVLNFADKLDEFRASIPSSVEDAVRRGAPGIRTAIVNTKLKDCMTSSVVLTGWEKNLCSAALAAAGGPPRAAAPDMQKALEGALAAKKDAIYRGRLAQEALKHAVFYDSQLERKVRARLQEITSTSAAVAQE